MNVFARKPVGSAEVFDLAPDLTFLALEPLGFAFFGGELLQICFDKGRNGCILLGSRNSGASVDIIAH